MRVRGEGEDEGEGLLRSLGAVHQLLTTYYCLLLLTTYSTSTYYY